MRDSLTVLAILLIAVLTTALVGPYFIDWNAHRGAIEARLSALAGAPVAIRGPIDLKLLPKPVFRFGSVAIGERGGPFGTIPGAAAAGPSLTADALNAELSLPALLRGQVQVVEATLVAPHLDLAQGSDGQLALPGLSSAEADRVALEHLGVRDGSVLLRFADGRRVALERIDLDVQATTLRGPFKATGAIGGIPLRLATGALESGRVRVKLAVDPAEGRPKLDLDGTLTLAGGPPAFAGTISAAGALSLRDTPATVPWQATAQAQADASGAKLTDVEIRAGADSRALILDGTGTVVPGGPTAAAPDLALQLHGAGLDVDALAVPPPETAVAPPQGAALIGLLLDAAGSREDRADLPVRLAVEAGFDTVSLAGRTLLGGTLRFGFGRGAGASLAVAAAGPDGARLSLDGHLLPGSSFYGRADATAADLPRFAAWLRPIAPDAAADLADLPARTIAVRGDLRASAGRLAMSAATVTLDGGRLAGSLAYEPASGADRPRFTADLTADRLDLDGAPDRIGAVAPGVDLDVALAAPAVRLSGPAGDASVEGGPFAIHLTRTGAEVDLDRFSLVVDGASVSATASRSGGQARAEARFDVPALGPLAGVLARLLPGPLSAAIAARAAALSPASGTLRAEASVGSGGGLVATRLDLDGTAGGTHVRASLVPDGGGSDAASRPLALTIDASAPDAAVPLRALGLPVADGAIGPGETHAAMRGAFATGFDVDARAALGDAALTYAGRIEPTLSHGRLTVSSRDLRPLLSAVGIWPAGPGGDAIPASGGGDLDWSGARLTLGGIAVEVAGAAAHGDLALAPVGSAAASPAVSGRLAIDRLPAATLLALGLGVPSAPAPGPPAGAWSTAPFGLAPVLPVGAVTLAVDRMPISAGLEAHAVAGTLRITRTGVELADTVARLGEGTIEARIGLQRDGPSATVSGHVAWRDLAPSLDDLSGRASGTLDLAGAGADPAALVRSLGGTGTLSLAAGVLARTDPAAPARTAAAFTVRDPLAVPDLAGLDPAAVKLRLARELDQAPLVLARQSVPIAASGGVLGVAGLRAEGEAHGSTGITADLRDLSLSVRTRLAIAKAGAPSGPDAAGPGEVVVTESGPIGARLERSIDATGLVDRLRALAVAKAQERIDVMEQDLRERAYFNRVLKAIQADQAAARQRALDAKAAADARQADAAREKADEARAQVESGAAARTAASAAETAAAKQRAIDQELKDLDGGLDSAAPVARRRHPRPRTAPDLLPPPSIIEGDPGTTARP